MQYENFLELLKYRRSIRKFKPDPIPDEYVIRVLDAAHYAMSGANSQPWEFIVVKDPEVKEEIYKAYLKHHDYVWHMEQQRIPEYRLPAFDVAPSEKDKSLAMVGGWKDAPIYIIVLEDRRKQWGSVLPANQRGRVLPQSMAHCTALIHLAAASLGLGSKRVDVSAQQPFREILRYPEPLDLDVIIPIGYRAYEPGPPHRLPLEELVHYDCYDMRKYMRNEDFFEASEKNPDAGKRLMVAYLKGLRQYNLGKTARNLEIIANFTKLDKEFLKKACWAYVPVDGRIKFQSLDEFQKWAVTKGYLDRPLSQDLLWEPSFIEEAHKILNQTP